MSIPLDRHYHYLKNLCGDDTIIYHWYPHGSKKLENLTPLGVYSDLNTVELNLSLTIFCHDQEPLFYENFSSDEAVKIHYINFPTPAWGGTNFYQTRIENMTPLRAASINPFNVYDKLLLCHSEKHSKELQKFEDNGFIGVYFWSHAIIARDWFRYAEHDHTLEYDNNFKYDFLIYNRAWAGTREYRLKFAEMLVNANLVSCCKTSFAPVDNGLEYTQHTFQNKDFKLNSFNLENYFIKNTSKSCYSADYDHTDYQECGIEVVLETLFDDQRNHLTEKALRPIACNKPFILTATPYSLQYLRSYGFKTFDGLIDETYDTIIDPYQRLEAVVSELKRISCLSVSNKQELWKKLNVIAQYNQQLFFSASWQDMILAELKTNLSQSTELAKHHRTGRYLIEQYKQLELGPTTIRTEAGKILYKWLKDNGADINI